eukprot:PhM_4_TR18870/c1_g1_i1/m.82945
MYPRCRSRSVGVDARCPADPTRCCTELGSDEENPVGVDGRPYDVIDGAPGPYMLPGGSRSLSCMNVRSPIPSVTDDDGSACWPCEVGVVRRCVGEPARTLPVLWMVVYVLRGIMGSTAEPYVAALGPIMDEWCCCCWCWGRLRGELVLGGGARCAEDCCWSEDDDDAVALLRLFMPEVSRVGMCLRASGIGEPLRAPALAFRMNGECTVLPRGAVCARAGGCGCGCGCCCCCGCGVPGRMCIGCVMPCRPGSDDDGADGAGSRRIITGSSCCWLWRGEFGTDDDCCCIFCCCRREPADGECVR